MIRTLRREQMQSGHALVLITAPDITVARAIANHLVETELAACVNIISPVESVYRWEGAVQREQEILLIAKTRMSLVESMLVEAVKSLHPYEVPEIIALPIQAGSHNYLNWIDSVTRRG
jgi:periplasmic divalent cation tolerance protein